MKMDFYHPIYADYSFFSFFSSQFLLISPPPFQIHSLYICRDRWCKYIHEYILKDKKINENTAESH